MSVEATNAAGLAQLDDMIARLRSLGGSLDDLAEDVADEVRAELERTIAAGTTPEGVAWQTTRSGKRPLEHAQQALHVAAVGRTIYVRLTGPEAMHHLGSARGGIERRVIPVKDIPPAMADRIRAVVERRVFSQLTGGV
jgi:hypothetical protein